ncbi:radical SAM protein [Haliangium sp.]|uniref:radical SAM protein n=1 Tax=Haliangium sp. TaxID=2663208 RepID=UPI003D12B19F
MAHEQLVRLSATSPRPEAKASTRQRVTKRRDALRARAWQDADSAELAQRDRWPEAAEGRVPVTSPHSRFRRERDCGYAYNRYNQQPSFLSDFEVDLLPLVDGARSIDELEAEVAPERRSEVGPALRRMIDLNLLRWSKTRIPDRAPTVEDLRPDAISAIERPSAPLVVHWEPTLRCNLRCATCYNESGPKAPIGVSADVVIPQLIESGVFLVTILGGEPMVDPHFYDNIRRLEEAGVGVEFVTNGWLLTDEHLERLLDTHICQIMVSVDGAEETHDRVRGRKNSFRRAIDGVRRFSDAGFDITVSLTVLRSNLEELEYMIDLSAEVGAAYMKLRPVVDSGRAKEQVETSEALSPDDVRAYQPLLHRKIDEHGGRLQFIHVSPLPTVGACFCTRDVSDTRYRTCRQGPCFIGRKLAYLRHDGGVAAHAFVREHVVGNITDAPLRSIWQNDDFWADVCP